MSVTITESNLNNNTSSSGQQTTGTNQLLSHSNQMLNYNNTSTQHNLTTPFQTNSSIATSNSNTQLSNAQLPSMNSSAQLIKKTGNQLTLQQGNQLKTIANAKPAANNSSTNSQSLRCRKVFIQRDYSEGTSVRFQNKFPDDLEGYIERQHFDYLITTLNCYYDKAEAANLSTFCEGLCACITAYLIYICMETHYEKYMRKTRDYINEQNDKVWKPRGLYVTDPIDRGLRILEITIGPRAQKRTTVSEQFKVD